MPVICKRAHAEAQRCREMSDSRLNQYQSYLDRAGCRMTPERKLAAEIIFHIDGPYVRETIYEQVIERSHRPDICRATVYRVLQQL